MRTSFQHLLAVCATVLLGLSALAACAPVPTIPPSHTASASGSPVFASDEEALAAAEKAYAAYLKAGDTSGTGEPSLKDHFLALSTGSAHDDDLSADRLFAERGWRTIGETSFDSMRLQSSGLESGKWEVRTYLCVDVRHSDVIDKGGRSVTKADRPLRVPLEVSFVTDKRANLLISESKVWSGTNFC